MRSEIGQLSSQARIVLLTQQVSNYHLARYRAAARRFKDLIVISLTNDAEFSEFLSADLSELQIVRLFNGKLEYQRAVANGCVWRDVNAALDRLAPEVVAIAGWSFPESLAAISWARLNQARIVLMSASQRHDSKRYRIREVIKSRIVKACDSALVGGRNQADYVVALGMAQERVFVGYDAVDNRHFHEGAERARESAADLRLQYQLPDRFILASSRFIPKKNMPRLLAAYAAAIKATGAPHALVILGDGTSRGEVEAAISRHALGQRVRLPGFKSYQTLPVYYGLADGFVHVALSEQWGLVINEAAASGLPLVVSAACGAAAELVQQGRNGYLVDAQSEASITDGLVAIMTATCSELRAMGAESQSVVAHWGPDRFGSGLISAVDVARDQPWQTTSFVDSALFRALSRHLTSAVS